MLAILIFRFFGHNLCIYVALTLPLNEVGSVPPLQCRIGRPIADWGCQTVPKSFANSFHRLCGLSSSKARSMSLSKTAASPSFISKEVALRTEQKRWKRLSTKSFCTNAASEAKTYRSREAQLEEKLALDHPEVLAATKIRQNRPARALEVLKAPLANLQSKDVASLSSDEKNRLHHLLGLRLQALVQMRETQEALRAAEQQTALFPRDATGVSNRGFVFAAAGDHISAAECQRAAIELATTSHLPFNPYIDARLRLAHALRSLGQLAEALGSLDTILQYKPAHYDALVLKASINVEMGRLDLAHETFLEAIRMDGSRAEAYAELGNLFYSHAAYEHASTFLKEALKRDPHHADALVYLGNVLVMTGMLNEAMTSYDSALLEDSKHVKALLSKAALLGRQRKFEDAIRHADVVIGINSNIAQAYATKGEAYELLGKSVEALQSFQKATDINDKFRKGYMGQFRVLHSTAKLDQLEGVANKAISAIPDFADAYFYLGITHTLRNRFAEAKEVFLKARQAAPESAHVAYSLVSCLARLREYDQAFTILEQTKSLDRKSVSYNHSMASLLNAVGRSDEAIEALDRAIAAGPKNVPVLQMRASILHRLGRFDDAHGAYDALIKVTPNPGRFHYAKANLYLQQKNYVYALDSLDTAVDIDAMLRPIVLKAKLEPLRKLGRDAEVEACQKELERLSVDNPANVGPGEQDLQYRPVKETREETLTEEQELNAMADELFKIKNTRLDQRANPQQ